MTSHLYSSAAPNTMKTEHSPHLRLIPNPLVKRRNLEWALTAEDAPEALAETLPTTAATESSHAQVDGYLSHSSSHLAARIPPSAQYRPCPSPRIPHSTTPMPGAQPEPISSSTNTTTPSPALTMTSASRSTRPAA